LWIVNDVLRIHSVKLRKKEESNYGYVDWLHYKNLLSSNNLDGQVKIAIIHHHLISMPSEEILDTTYPYGSISVTLDSGKVIEGLQKKRLRSCSKRPPTFPRHRDYF
jgi:hypothetical protein